MIHLAKRISFKAPIKNFFSTGIQQKYVYDTYDLIAQHFDHTRFARWPKVKAFLNSLEKASIVYDVGCGNGKYLGQPQCYMLGTDRSTKLLEICRRKNDDLNMMAADACNLPIRSGSCDAVLSIAVLHHLSGKSARLKALSQLFRVLKDSGRGLVYVWCLQQTIKNKQPLPEQLIQQKEQLNRQQDILINWHLQEKFCSSEADYKRVDEKKSYLIKRYYHLFKMGELEGLFNQLQNVEILQSYYDKENWCVEFRKVSESKAVESKL